MLGILGTLAKSRPDEKPDPTALSVRARAFATLGLVVLAGIGREHPSVLLWTCRLEAVRAQLIRV